MHKTVVFMMLLALITTGCDKSAETADSSPSATDGSMAPDTGGDLGVDLSPPDAALPDQGAPDSAPPDQGAPDVTVSCPSTPPAKGSPCKSYPGGTTFLSCAYAAQGLTCACMYDKWDCAPKK